MLKVNVESKVGTRRLLQFFTRYRRVRTLHEFSLEHPCKGIAPPWSSQEPSAYYKIILCLWHGGSLMTAYNLLVRSPTNPSG
jgi:hypothetical protein